MTSPPVTNTQVFTTGELQADVGGVGKVVVRRLDTSELASVRTVAEEVLDTKETIPVFGFAL